VEHVLGDAPKERGHAYGQKDEHEPEPQDGVDLLVDDVERHHAHGVMRLHGAGRPELVEVALGHLGKHPVEQPVAVVVVERVQPISVELAAQELVHDLHLEQDVDQVEHLAPDEHRGPVAVQTEPGNRVQVVHDVPHFRPPGRLGRYAPVTGHRHVLVTFHPKVQPLQPVDEQRDGARLVRAPYEMRQVEQQGLTEQHERHPLVVRVTDGARVPVHGADARVRRVVGVGHRVRGGKEAVRVDDVVGHAGGDAPDMLSDVLTAAHQRGARQQYGERQPVVDAERRVVDDHQLDPTQSGLADDRAEHADHGEIGLRTECVSLPSTDNAKNVKRSTTRPHATAREKTKLMHKTRVGTVARVTLRSTTGAREPTTHTAPVQRWWRRRRRPPPRSAPVRCALAVVAAAMHFSSGSALVSSDREAHVVRSSVAVAASVVRAGVVTSSCVCRHSVVHVLSYKNILF